jgi:hypothetical protein
MGLHLARYEPLSSLSFALIASTCDCSVRRTGKRRHRHTHQQQHQHGCVQRGGRGEQRREEGDRR